MEDTQEPQENAADTQPEATTETAAPAPPAEKGRNTRKERVGRVVSDKMQRSITVAVERRERHPLYGKFVKKTSKFMAHDASDECRVGDLVRIMETRPLSKNKRWRLVEILERAK